MPPLLAVLLVASWVSAIAIVSVQNATPVTLHFLVWRSVSIPFGVVLAFSVTAGAGVMALLQVVWGWLAPRESGAFPFEPRDDSLWEEDEFDDR